MWEPRGSVQSPRTVLDGCYREPGNLGNWRAEVRTHLKIENCDDDDDDEDNGDDYNDDDESDDDDDDDNDERIISFLPFPSF